MTRVEIAELIERFLAGTAGPHEWDDFESVPLADPDCDSIRAQCARIRDHFPPRHASEFCNEQGAAELARMAEHCRQQADRGPSPEG